MPSPPLLACCDFWYSLHMCAVSQNPRSTVWPHNKTWKPAASLLLRSLATFSEVKLLF